MLWDATTQQVYFLDWEVIGVGNGPQDIAQYGISHMSPAYRRENEISFLKHYYETLTKDSNFINEYDYETCYNEYVMGGICRWVWMLPLLANMCPTIVTQYFHDQVYEFIKDHNMTPEKIEMPRV